MGKCCLAGNKNALTGRFLRSGYNCLFNVDSIVWGSRLNAWLNWRSFSLLTLLESQPIRTTGMRDDLFREPVVTPIMICPACGETLLYGLRECRYCNEPIDEEYARRSATYCTAIARICSLANTIRTIRPAVGLVVVGGTLGVLLGFGRDYAVYFMSMSVLYSAAVLRWRWKYGDLVVPDDEFKEAQRMMKRELHLWLGLISVEIFVLFTAWRLLGRN